MEIIKCLCGGNGSIPEELYSDMAHKYVLCDKCGKESLSWNYGIDAIRNWNLINEVSK